MTQVFGIQQALLEWRHRAPSATEREQLLESIRDSAARVERLWCGCWTRSPLQKALQQAIPSRGTLQRWQVEALLASLQNPRAHPSLWVFVARRCASLLTEQMLGVSLAVRVQGVALVMKNYLSRSERASLETHLASLPGLAKLDWAHDAVMASEGAREAQDPGFLVGLTELLSQVMEEVRPSELTEAQLVWLIEVWERVLDCSQDGEHDPSWSSAQRQLWLRWLPELQIPLGPTSQQEVSGAEAPHALFSRTFRLLRELGRSKITAQEGRWWTTLAFWCARHLDHLPHRLQKEVLVCFAEGEPLWRQCALALDKQSLLYHWVGTLTPEQGAEQMLHPSILAAGGAAARHLPHHGLHWEALFRMAARKGRLTFLREFLLSFCNAPIPHVFSSETLVAWSLTWKMMVIPEEQSQTAAEWSFWLERSLRSSKAPGHAALCSALLPHPATMPLVLQVLHDLPHRVMVQWFHHAAAIHNTTKGVLEAAASIRKKAFKAFKASSQGSWELQQLCTRIHDLIASQEGLLQGRPHPHREPAVLRALVARGVGDPVFASREMRQLSLNLPQFSNRAHQIAAICNELLKNQRQIWMGELQRCLYFLDGASPAMRRAWLDLLEPLPAESQGSLINLLQSWYFETPCPLPAIVAWAAKAGALNWLQTAADWLFDEADSAMLPADPVEAAWACQGLWHLQEALEGRAEADTIAVVRKLGMRWLVALPSSDASLHRESEIDMAIVRRLRRGWGSDFTLEHTPVLGPSSSWSSVLRQRGAFEMTGALKQGLLPGWREELARGWQQMCETLEEIRESTTWSPIALEAYQWSMARIAAFGSPAASLGLLWELPMPPGAQEESLLGRLRESLRAKVKLEVADWQKKWLSARAELRVDGDIFQQPSVLNLAFRLDWKALPPAPDEVEEQPFPEAELLRALDYHEQEERPAAQAAILRLKRVLVDRHAIVALDERDRFAWTNRQNARLRRILQTLDREKTVSVFWPHLQDALEGCATRWAEGLRRLEAQFFPYGQGIGEWSLTGLAIQWMRSIRRDHGAVRAAELLIGTGSVHSQNLILARFPGFFGLSQKELEAITRDRYVEQIPDIHDEDLEQLLVALCSPRVVVEELARRLAALPWLREAEEEPSLLVVIERLAEQQTDRFGQPLTAEAQTQWIHSHAGWLGENLMTAESCQPLALELCLAAGWMRKVALA
jgi:hypothetical protein